MSVYLSMYLSIYLPIYLPEEIYYKVLAHMIMEVVKSYNLPSAS